MIERKFVKQNLKEYEVTEFLFQELTRAGLSEVKLQRTPVGQKIVVKASRPGLVVGKGGSNINKITRKLEEEFGFENPQIEIEEVKDFRGNATITAEMIANTLERFGPTRFKGTGHKSLSNVMNSGALGVEILISGKIPSSRSRTWRFYQGYLKKCGEVATTEVDTAYQTAFLKTGSVGIQVRIMPGDIELPDHLEVAEEPEVEEVKEEDETEAIKEIKEKAAKAQKQKEEAEKKAKETKKAEDKKPSTKEEKEAEKETSKKTDKKPAPKKEKEEADVEKKTKENEEAKPVEESVEHIDAPNSNNTKKEMKEYLDYYGVEYKSSMLKDEIYDLVKETKSKHSKKATDSNKSE